MAGAAWASAESAAWALGMAEAFTSKSAVPMLVFLLTCMHKSPNL